MRERAALLNLVAELRGRLDELERQIQTAPNWVVMTPASYDEEGVVDLTPEAYRTVRADGLGAPLTLTRYKPLNDFAQFGAPEGAGEVEVTSFALSDLHRIGPEPAHGLRFQPHDSGPLAWFTHEILTDGEGLQSYQWLEWVLKLSMDRPTPCFVQIIVECANHSAHIDIGTVSVGDFAAFSHIRVDRARLMDAAGGRPIRRLRLTLSTGETPVGMNLYAFSLFARA